MGFRPATIAPVIFALAMTACAKRPNAIAPATIPASAYSNLNCADLARELQQERNQLAVMSKAQNSAATADAVGVFLVGVPAASLTGGDNEGDIAVTKGKIVAIEGTQKGKGC